MSNIDCRFTDEVVCPYCGQKFSDSWELDDSDDEMYCDECEKDFAFERHVIVTYSSYKK